MPNQDFPLKALELVEAFGWLYGWESVALSVFVKGVLPADAKIVNVGSGVGTSGLSMKLGNPKANITTVDISAGGPLGGLENERNAFEKAPGVPLPTQVLGDSSTIGKTWKGGDLDLVLIDGDHSREGITKDIDAWYPHVKAGGYIGFHDYQALVWADVKNVVDAKMAGDEKILHVDTLIIFKKLSNFKSYVDKDGATCIEVPECQCKQDEAKKVITSAKRASKKA